MYCHKMVSDLVKIKPDGEVNNEPLPTNTQAGFARKLKPLEEVTCYKVIMSIFNIDIVKTICKIGHCQKIQLFIYFGFNFKYIL